MFAFLYDVGISQKWQIGENFDNFKEKPLLYRFRKYVQIQSHYLFILEGNMFQNCKYVLWYKNNFLGLLLNPILKWNFEYFIVMDEFFWQHVFSTFLY